MRPIRLFLVLPLLLAGCAGTAPVSAYTVAQDSAVAAEAQRQEAIVRSGFSEPMKPSFSTRFSPNERLQAVAERVLMAAAPYCGRQVRPGYAVSVGQPRGNPPTVVNSTGKVKPGDVVVAIEGQQLARGEAGFDQMMKIGIGRLHAGQPMTLTVRRGSLQLSETYAPVPACAFAVQLENHNEWNAYADGEVLHAELKLVTDVSNDDELAFVLAHELSHNLLGHVQKQQQNVLAGVLVGAGLDAVLGSGGELTKIGAQAGQMTYSQDYEREADYVGLYLTEAAGYDIAAGPRLARRIAEQDPRSIYYASSHPSSAERAASLQITANEIIAKRNAGQPIVPNVRKR